MKTTIYGLLVFLCTQGLVYGQETVIMGGASTTVSRTFVIEDELRIRETEDKTNDPTYDQVLVADANGNIDRVPKDSFVGTANNNENKLYYLDSNPRSGMVAIDKFLFYFRPSTTEGKHLDVMLRLAEDPGTDTFVYYTLYRKFNMYNNKWLPTPSPKGTYPTEVRGEDRNKAYLNGKHRNYYKANHKKYLSGNKSSIAGDFTPKNWADGQLLCPGFDVGDFAEVWLSFPGNPVAYRAVFYARQNANELSYGMRKSYTILVEKFENKDQ